MGGVCCRPEVGLSLLESLRPLINWTSLQPIDFDGDVNLFHFVLLRSVGKGAFGKVRLPLRTRWGSALILLAVAAPVF